MDFSSSSSLQITTHILSCPGILALATTGSILSVTQVVLDHDWFMKDEELFFKLSILTKNNSISFLEL